MSKGKGFFVLVVTHPLNFSSSHLLIMGVNYVRKSERKNRGIKGVSLI